MAAKARRMNAASFRRDLRQLSPRLRHRVCTLDPLAAEVACARRRIPCGMLMIMEARVLTCARRRPDRGFPLREPPGSAEERKLPARPSEVAPGPVVGSSEESIFCNVRGCPCLPRLS